MAMVNLEPYSQHMLVNKICNWIVVILQCWWWFTRVAGNHSTV